MTNFGPTSKDEKLIEKVIERLEDMEYLLITVDYFIADFRKEMEELAMKQMEKKEEKKMEPKEPKEPKFKKKTIAGQKVKYDVLSKLTKEDIESGDQDLAISNYYSKYGLSAEEQKDAVANGTGYFV